uniref:Irl1 n=1 Tax=Arundo donax TaxID=35708 RepID=A0A0A9F3V8_ARUDO
MSPSSTNTTLVLPSPRMSALSVGGAGERTCPMVGSP